MNKKGFTLIELLAVIVVLAIIALIATPIILNVIDKTKKGATQDSVYGIAEAAEMYYTKKMASNEEFNAGVISIDDLSYKGKVDSGSVVFNEKGKYAILIFNGKYCGYKYIGGQEAYVGEISEGGCEVEGNVITLEDIKVAAGQDASNQLMVETASIDDDGIITIKNDKYKISADGKISKNGTEITDDDLKNESYEKVVKAILSGTESTSKMLEHQEILDGVKTNEKGTEVITSGFIDYFSAYNNIDFIKSDLDDINSRIDRLDGGTATIIQGNAIKNNLSNYKDSLNNVINKADIIIENYNNILENGEFIEVIANVNAELMVSNSNYFNSIINNENYFNNALKSETFRLAMYNNASTTESLIASSSTALTVLKNNSKSIVCDATTRIESGTDTIDMCVNSKVFILETTFRGDNTLSINFGDFVQGQKTININGNKYGYRADISLNKFASVIKTARVGTSARMYATITYFEI